MKIGKDINGSTVRVGDWITFVRRGSRVPIMAKVCSFTKTGTPRIKCHNSDKRANALIRIAGTSKGGFATIKLWFIKVDPMFEVRDYYERT